ncbi:MAG: cobalamin-independent methionine synthase II family protein [Rhodospirillales bacterium]|jgi:5-methyltetrahydropteroyltriglutamate--homocysteine methyltransferase|nr:cobalamin-independent methionine synthase II family protein [Rhodospirillales bacterium]
MAPLLRSSAERILTTHVGSLPRPPGVVDLLMAREEGVAVDEDAFETAVREAVAAVVARQVEVGVDTVSDGEMGKVSYVTYMKERLSGFGGSTVRAVPTDLLDFPDYPATKARLEAPGAREHSPACVGPVAMENREPLDRDIANFRAAVEANGPTDAFLTAGSPGLITAIYPNQHYPDYEAYLEAVAEAMRAEYEAIAEAGFVVQIDSPDLALTRHMSFQDLTDEEFHKRLAQHVEALNHALRSVPAERSRLHLCWGNYEGPHHHDVALADIIGTVLAAKPRAISFEASNPRHAHEWQVWEEVNLGDDRILIPGVIDTLTNFVEHPELVAERIGRFAAIVGRERVIAGTDCGFGTFAGIERVHSEIAYAKLKSLVEGAEIASNRLWG